MSNNAKVSTLFKGCFLFLIGYVCILSTIDSVLAQTTQPINLDIAKTASHAERVPGQPLTWTVTVTKMSPHSSIDFTLQDNFPSGFILDFAASTFPLGGVTFNQSSNQINFVGNHNGAQG